MLITIALAALVAASDVTYNTQSVRDVMTPLSLWRHVAAYTHRHRQNDRIEWTHNLRRSLRSLGGDKNLKIGPFRFFSDNFPSLDRNGLVLFGVSSRNVTRLQRAQNAAARVVVWGSRRRSTNSLCLLERLHWWPIEWRAKFKIACITYKTISTNEPAYLHSLLKHHVPSRSLRSSDSNLLSVPRVRTCFGSRSFAVGASTIWSTLPSDIRNSPSICCFRRHLKTFFYNLVLAHLSPHHIPCASDSAGFSRWHCAQYKFTYLLTYLHVVKHEEIRMYSIWAKISVCLLQVKKH